MGIREMEQFLKRYIEQFQFRTITSEVYIPSSLSLSFSLFPLVSFFLLLVALSPMMNICCCCCFKGIQDFLFDTFQKQSFSTCSNRLECVVVQSWDATRDSYIRHHSCRTCSRTCTEMVMWFLLLKWVVNWNVLYLGFLIRLVQMHLQMMLRTGKLLW